MFFFIVSKQWLLAANLRDSLINRANLARRVTFFQKRHLANVGKSGKSLQNILANVGESRTFPKNATLANACTCQKCRNFGEYLHSQNSRASCHCLILSPFFQLCPHQPGVCRLRSGRGQPSSGGSPARTVRPRQFGLR